MSKDRFYEKKVKKINDLQEALRNDPENESLQAEIKKEEEELFAYVVQSSKELEQFLDLYEVNTSDDDED